MQIQASVGLTKAVGNVRALLIFIRVTSGGHEKLRILGLFKKKKHRAQDSNSNQGRIVLINSAPHRFPNVCQSFAAIESIALS